MANVVQLHIDENFEPKPPQQGKYMYEIVSFRYRPYERIPSFTWKYLIETTCIIKQTDGGPYVADFTVFPKV